MRLFFGAGLRLISFFSPWGRAALLVVLFAAPVFAAGQIDQREPLGLALTWGLFLIPVYITGALVLWGQLGMARISRAVDRIALGDLSVRVDRRGTGRGPGPLYGLRQRGRAARGRRLQCPRW